MAGASGIGDKLFEEVDKTVTDAGEADESTKAFLKDLDELTLKNPELKKNFIDLLLDPSGNPTSSIKGLHAAWDNTQASKLRCTLKKLIPPGDRASKHAQALLVDLLISRHSSDELPKCEIVDVSTGAQIKLKFDGISDGSINAGDISKSLDLMAMTLIATS